MDGEREGGRMSVREMAELYGVAYEPLTEQSRTIHDNHLIVVPWNWTCNADTKTMSITWDPKKTTLTGAELYVKAFSSKSSMYLEYYVNDNLSISLDWPALQTGWREDRKDVLAWIRNGTNAFKAQICKGFYYPLSSEVYVTAILTLFFEGEEPDMTPPSPPIEWWQWLMIGGVAIAGVFAAGYIIKAFRK
jgi:hypothetical protein